MMESAIKLLERLLPPAMDTKQAEEVSKKTSESLDREELRTIKALCNNQSYEESNRSLVTTDECRTATV